MKFLIFLSLMIAPGDIDVIHLRMLYANAATDAVKAKQLILLTEKEKQNSVAQGYYGAAKMVNAKFYFNPISKLSSFNSGKAALESAIYSDSNNPELRYLRLTIQKNAPSFLRYNDNISEDQNYLIQNLSFIRDEQLKTIIRNYLKTI